jgi:hypothetical protein
VTYVQVLPGLCGGFTGAARARRDGVTRGVAQHAAMLFTAVLQAASLHFGAAHRRRSRASSHHRFTTISTPRCRHRCGASSPAGASIATAGLGVAPT